MKIDKWIPENSTLEMVKQNTYCLFITFFIKLKGGKKGRVNEFLASCV